MTRVNGGSLSPAYILLLLFLANLLNIADRSLLGIVVDPVKADLGLSDTAMSIVSGSAFVFFNLLMGLVIARWVDRGNRKLILILGITLWSAATALTGLAQDFFSLALTRVLVGVGEATCFPVAISMIADLYAPARRPRTISIFHASTFVGIVLGSILAGVLAAAHGWRAMFAICGLAGFALVGLMILTMSEPARGPADEAVRDTNLGGSIAHLIGRPGFVALSLGVAFATMAVAVLPVWAPAFLLRSHGVQLADVGALIGPAVGIGGITGTVFSGFMASRLARIRGSEIHGLLVPIVALPLAAPLYAVFLFAPSLGAAMSAAAVMNFLLATALGPCIAAAVAIAPVQMRAVASTLMLVATGVIGWALAPMLVGGASDLLVQSAGSESLRYGLAMMAPMPLIGAALLWLAYARTRPGRAVAE